MSSDPRQKLAAQLQDLDAEQKRALLEKLLAQQNEKKSVESDNTEDWPLSFAQQRLWFIDQLQPGGSAYTIPTVLQLDGELDAERLQQCLGIIIERHEILRTRFVANDDAVPQQIIDAPSLPELPVVDIASTDQVQTYLQNMMQQAFALDSGPLLRAQLLRVAAESHVLLLCVHHIIADYWSLRVLMREIAMLYASPGDIATNVLPALSIQYLDYSVWQRERQHEIESELDYWQQQLADMPGLLQLPTDYPRPAQQSFRGARYEFQLSSALSKQIRQLSSDAQSTVFSTLLAGLQAVLFRYSGQHDFAIGTTATNRNRDELRDLIGLFVNNLVLRARPDYNMPFAELLAQANQTTLDAIARQELPFERIVDALDPDRELSHNALFQVMFVLHNTPVESLELPGLAMRSLPLAFSSARFDLSLDMVDDGDALHGFFEYSTDLFKHDSVVRLTHHLITLLEQVCEQPNRTIGSVSLLEADDLAAIARWNATATAINNTPVHCLIEQQSQQTPDAVAASHAGQSLSYQQLNARADHIACALQQQGVGKGERVALMMPRGLDLLTSMLAILKCGASYLPLDPTHPAERIAHILDDALLEDAANAWLITANSNTDVVVDNWQQLSFAALHSAQTEQTASATVSGMTAEDICYCIYTSGSTGKPKGVPIQHSSLVNCLQSMAEKIAIQPHDRLLAVTTIAFDIATLEMLMPLISGACVVIADDDDSNDARRLQQLLDDNAISLMQATPASWRLLMETDWTASQGFRCLCGGEALDAVLARELLQRGCALWNLYGPTETTIWSGALAITQEMLDDGVVPIGGALANTGLHVLEPSNQLAAPGIAAELCISGAGLSPGYHNRDSLTAERFTAITQQDGSSLRVYRTGDLVSRCDNGMLVYRGRLDHQVKLRGYRIELGEIQNVLLEHSAVSSALVMLDELQQTRLLAYCEITGEDIAQDMNEQIRDWLDQKLPSYMVPAVIMTLQRMPLTPNGKIDRKALPAPESQQQQAVPLYTDTEKRLASMWSELLSADIVDAKANFFHAGGHSLLAARLAARIAKQFDVQLPVRTIFERASLQQLAAGIDELKLNSHAGFNDIQARSADADLQMSHAQHRQWVLAGLEPDNPYYNIPAAITVNEALDNQLLQQALDAIVARHDVLHTAYRTVDGHAKVELCEPASANIEQHVIDAHAIDDKQQAVFDVLQQSAQQCFDLAAAPLIRMVTVDTGNQHIVMLVIHHIAGDAWSLQILFRELMQYYVSLQLKQAIQLPALPLQYLDYAAWEREHDNTASLNYWQQQLAGAPPLLDLPTDLPRPVDQGFDAEEVRFNLPANVATSLQQLGHEHNASMFMVLLAAFNSLLYRYSGADDIVIGCPVGHRPHHKLEDVVGLFVNTLPIRVLPDGEQPFTHLLNSVRETTLQAFAHQDAAFEEIINRLDIPRSWGHAPLFQVMFLWQPESLQQRHHGSDSWSPLVLPARSTKVDLTLSMGADNDGGLSGRFEYRSDLFHPHTMHALADAFSVMLAAIADNAQHTLAALPLLNTTQLDTLRAWNDTSISFPARQNLQQLFEQQADINPEAVALLADDAELDYQTLNTRANGIAHQLLEKGVQADDRIAVCLPRDSKLIVAILGILKAGAAYVPLDPKYPIDRIAFIIDDADIRFIITDKSLSHGLSVDNDCRLDIDDFSEQVSANPQTTTGPANLAYIIYTSGSTGVPKGVSIEHHSAIALVQWAQQEYSRERLAGVLCSTSVCFDLSVFEIFVPLCTGGSIVLAENALHLTELAARDRVTLINTVPTAAAELVRSNAIPANVSTVNIAGEPLPTAVVKKLYNCPGIDRVYNLYGPSEDTTYSTGCILDANEAMAFSPIGRPISNTCAWVLDANLRPVAPGFPGELYLSGDGVSRGYWQRPSLTAERYVPNPFVTETDGHYKAMLYKTGDRVRLRHDGELAFLGRLDNQVKLRGFRIELGEIEAALENHSAVTQAVAHIHQHDAHTDAEVSPTSKRLVAYLTLSSDNNVEQETADDGATLTAASHFAETLRQHLLSSLPDYMLPGHFVVLNAIPLLPNGKVARRQLPAPDLQGGVLTNEDSALTAEETRMADIWRDILKQQAIGPHDNFFALGGDSILALQLVALARQQGLIITARDIFQSPTVAGLTAQALLNGPVLEQAMPSQQSGLSRLTPIQQWFFEQPLQYPHQWNQAVLLEVDRAINSDQLIVALESLMQAHDALRSKFIQDENSGEWQRDIADFASMQRGDLPLLFISSDDEQNIEQLVQKVAADIQQGFDLEEGPLWSVAVIEAQYENQTQHRLLFICHHLLVDGVSWRILLGDLQQALLQLDNTNNAVLPPASTPVSHWVNSIAQHTISEDERHFWHKQLAAHKAILPLDNEDGSNCMRDSETISVQFDKQTTEKLLYQLPEAYSVQLDELMLAALARVLSPWSKQAELVIELEGHGRPDLDDDKDLSRSVGWFTSLYPLAFHTWVDDAENALKLIKSKMRDVKQRGFGFSVLQAFDDDFQVTLPAQIRFNYLGQTDQLFPEGSWFKPATETIGALRHPDDPRGIVFDINALVRDGCLKLLWSYSRELHEADTVQALVDSWQCEIRQLLAHCLADTHQGGYIDQDFPLMAFHPGELDGLLGQLKQSFAGKRFEDMYPLSPMQQGLLFHSLLAPRSGQYVPHIVLELSGKLDSKVLLAAWNHVIGLHPALRSSFVWDMHEQAFQLVSSNVELGWNEQDWRDQTAQQQHERLRALMAASQSSPLDLRQAPLMRIQLVRRDDERYTLIWAYHHLVLDGWSAAAVLEQVFTRAVTMSIAGNRQLTAGGSATGKPYSDYITWLARQDRSASEAFWREHLTTPEKLTELPLPSPSSSDDSLKQTDGQLEKRIDVKQSQQLRDFAAAQQVTLNTVIQAAFAVLLSRYNNNDTVVFGNTVSGRPAELASSDRMIGMFINTLPVQVRCSSEQSVGDFLRTLQARQAATVAHEHVALHDLQEWINDGHSLFDCLYVFESYPLPESLSAKNSPLHLDKVVYEERTHFPLTLQVADGEQLKLAARYNAARYVEQDIERMLSHLNSILDGMLASAESALWSLPMLSSDEHTQLATWNATQAALPDYGNIIDWLHDQAQQTPEQIALRYADVSLSYAELHTQANQLAHKLRELGAATETVVAIHLQRCPALLIAILATIKSGAAYLPLDPDQPAARLQSIVDDAAPAVLIFNTETEKQRVNVGDNTRLLDLSDLNTDTLPTTAPDITLQAENAMYVIYTSGSTGKPKGVINTHGALINRLHWMQKSYQLNNDDRVLQKTPVGFDVSVWELFWPLLTGASMIMAEPDKHRDGSYLTQLIEETGVTTLHFVPPMLNAFLDAAEPNSCSSLKRVICSGEALTPALQKRFFEYLPNAELHNLYGPTEAAIDVTAWQCHADNDVVPIGFPIDNTVIRILDHTMQPVPVGVPGELHIGGCNLARGYLGNANLTARSFIPDPLSPKSIISKPITDDSDTNRPLLYRSGDLARWREDGAIEYLGRIDHQIKLRGVRIELGEIENAINALADVGEARVLLRDDIADEAILVAYVIADDEQSFEALTARETAAWKAAVQDSLPPVMIPTAWVVLEAFPLSVNGKVDRRRLPAPSATPRGQMIAPRNATEKVVAEVWSEVLRIKEISIQDDFLMLGGHSLNATRVNTRLRKRLDIELPLNAHFRFTTLEALANHIDALRMAQQNEEESIDNAGDDNTVEFEI